MTKHKVASGLRLPIGTIIQMDVRWCLRPCLVVVTLLNDNSEIAAFVAPVSVCHDKNELKSMIEDIIGRGVIWIK